MSGVTLDELLKEVGISPTQLNKPCTSEHLQGLFKVQVEDIERETEKEKEKRQAFLESWKAKFAFKATYMVIVKALLKIGRADQAEQVCRVLVPQQPKEGTLLNDTAWTSYSY